MSLNEIAAFEFADGLKAKSEAKQQELQKQLLKMLEEKTAPKSPEPKSEKEQLRRTKKEIKFNLGVENKPDANGPREPFSIMASREQRERTKILMDSKPGVGLYNLNTAQKVKVLRVYSRENSKEERWKSTKAKNYDLE